MSAQRIQRKRTKGWRMPDGAVYVGRPTKWGNPFKVKPGTHPIGDVYSVWGHYCTGAVVDDAYEEAVRRYRSLLFGEAEWTMVGCRPPDHPTVRADIVGYYPSTSNGPGPPSGAGRIWRLVSPVTLDEVRSELAGRDLVCWCPLDVPCHADVLLELANPGYQGEHR